MAAAAVEERRSFCTIIRAKESLFACVLPPGVSERNELSSEVTLVSHCGSSWSVGITRLCGDSFIERGWRAFCIDNRIVLDDVVLFRPLSSSRVLIQVFGSDGNEKNQEEQQRFVKETDAFTPKKHAEDHRKTPTAEYQMPTPDKTAEVPRPRLETQEILRPVVEDFFVDIGAEEEQQQQQQEKGQGLEPEILNVRKSSGRLRLRRKYVTRRIAAGFWDKTRGCRRDEINQLTPRMNADDQKSKISKGVVFEDEDDDEQALRTNGRSEVDDQKKRKRNAVFVDDEEVQDQTSKRALSRVDDQKRRKKKGVVVDDEDDEHTEEGSFENGIVTLKNITKACVTSELSALEAARRFVSKFPTVVLPMVKSALAPHYYLQSKQFDDFADKLTKKDIDMIMLDVSDRKFPVRFLPDRHAISGGWRSFVRAHKITISDAVVVELLDGSTFRCRVFRGPIHGRNWRVRSEIHK